MKLRDYQSRVVEFCRSRQKAFGVAPAGSGKTIIAADLVAKLAKPFDRIVWLANTREQVEQANAAMAKIAPKHPVEVHACCVASRPDVSDADILIIDECHHLPAATWWQTAINAQGRVFGFSATPWSGDWERDNSLKAFFGEANFITIPRAEVQMQGSITDGVVFIHSVDTPGQFDAEIQRRTEIETEKRCRRWRMIPAHEHRKRAMWQITAEMVKANERRNDKIVELASRGDAVLVLVSSIEHGQWLNSRIPGSQLVYSRLPKKQRKLLIENFRDGTLRCMIATSLADEGLDVPRAAVLVLASGGRSASKIEQRAGRVMRPHASKEIGTVHDFSDEGAALAHNQFKARAKIYKRLGYKITAK